MSVHGELVRPANPQWGRVVLAGNALARAAEHGDPAELADALAAWRSEVGEDTYDAGAAASQPARMTHEE